MPKLLLTLLTGYALLACNASRPRDNSYTLTEVSRQTSRVPVKKMLIAAHGGTGTRFFMDNVVKILRERLVQKGITVDYEFIGFRETVEEKTKALMNRSEYDALLRFVPKQTEADPIRFTEVWLPAPGGTLNAKVASVRYAQEFDLVLIAKKDTTAVLWKGRLNANLDSRQPRFYPKIAEDVLRYLEGVL